MLKDEHKKNLYDFAAKNGAFLRFEFFDSKVILKGGEGNF